MLLSVLVPALVLLVLLVEALGPLFILVDLVISVLIRVLPVVALTGAQQESEGSNKQAQKFHLAR